MTQNAQQLDGRDEAAIRSVLLGHVDAVDGRDFDRIADAFTEGARTRTQVIAHHRRGTGYFHTGGTYIDSLVQT